MQFFGSEQRLASRGVGKCAHRGLIVKWVQECGRSWESEGFAGSFFITWALDFFAMNSSLAFVLWCQGCALDVEIECLLTTHFLETLRKV